MTTLIIDNYDSFTHNLAQLVGALGARPVTARNDALSLAGVRALRPSRVIFSPGPGHPDDPRRLGICRAILRELSRELPILGVCLGHQAVVSWAGGKIVRSREVMHGKASLIHHDGDGIFAGLPTPFEAMRYHSLVADPTAIPPSLAVTARSPDGAVMAVRHARYSVYGVQFHPESIGTPVGRALIESFVRLIPRARLEPASVGDHA